MCLYFFINYSSKLIISIAIFNITIAIHAQRQLKIALYTYARLQWLSFLHKTIVY
jgi:hypothetical protein